MDNSSEARKPELDAKGREIFPGDLLKSFHYKPARRNHPTAYLYHTAVLRDGKMWMVPTSHLEPTKVSGGGECLLKYATNTPEIIDGFPFYLDRPRSKESHNDMATD